VFVHLIVAEMKLGRFVARDEVVHHRDENRLNNDPSNLEVKTRSKHTREHGVERGTRMVRLSCPSCQVLFERERRQTHLAKPGRRATCCSEHCRGVFSGLLRRGGPELAKRLVGHVKGEFTRKTDE
jgi:hypothetical protein